MNLSIAEILNKTDHRAWGLPNKPWVWYQEWRDVLFLHWQIPDKGIRASLPPGLEPDTIDGHAWVSLVLFTMRNVRPRGLFPFAPVSDFHEINLRTYVRYRDRPGIYFLSIEGGKRLSCAIAGSISGFPYRFVPMRRSNGQMTASYPAPRRSLDVRYEAGEILPRNEPDNLWLTERYAVYLEADGQLCRYHVHHVPWPLRSAKVGKIELEYPALNGLSAMPDKVHYAEGVQVVAWRRENV